MFSSTRSKVLSAVCASAAVVLPLAVSTAPAGAVASRVPAPAGAATSHVFYGVNPGGWRTLGQNAPSAYQASVAAYGQLGFMRLWPNTFNTTWRGGLIPSYVYDAKTPVYINLGSDVAGVNTGARDAAWTTILKSAPTDRPIWFSFAHEPEGDGFTVAAWQQAQMRLAALKTKHARANVKFAPLLMGASFIGNRYQAAAAGNVPWSTWFNFDLKNIDAMGADLYQWGTNDATADLASRVINPTIAAAKSKGKKLLIGELGTRNTLSDASRAKFLREAIALFDGSSTVTAVAYFESDNGAKGPWNLLPKPGTSSWNYPSSIKAWRGAVQSSR